MNKSAKLRTIIVGLGAMGSRHLNVAQRGELLDVVGVVDPSAQIDSSPIKKYTSLEDAVVETSCQAAIVAVPCKEHFSVSKALLKVNIPVLLEKPFTLESKEAELLIECSGRVPFMVGHSERFNPAFRALKKELKRAGKLKQIACVRKVPLTENNRDRSVLYDLAVHDVDLFFRLDDQELDSVEIELIRYEQDSCSFFIKGANEIHCGIDVERGAAPGERTITVEGDRGILYCDLLYKKLSFLKKGDTNEEIQVLLVEEFEPLMKEHAHFASMVWDNRTDIKNLERAQKSVAVCEVIQQQSYELIVDCAKPLSV